MASFDAAWFALLQELGIAAIELSPLSPLGTVAAVTPVDQVHRLVRAAAGQPQGTVADQRARNRTAREPVLALTGLPG